MVVYIFDIYKVCYGAELVRKDSPLPTCHVSCVTCQMSRVTCHMSHVSHVSVVSCFAQVCLEGSRRQKKIVSEPTFGDLIITVPD